MPEIEKGDLVEYLRLTENRVGAPTKIDRGVVQGTERDWWVIKGCVDIKRAIIDSSKIVKVLERQAIPKRLFRYLEQGWSPK